MIDRLFHSIVFRIGSMMFIISFVAIISMFSSMFVSELADKDALAINHSGSMRMQSYKILSNFEMSYLLRQSEAEGVENWLEKDLEDFEAKLNAPVLMQPLDETGRSAIAISLASIKQNWRDQVKPYILQLHSRSQLDADDFMNLKYRIDNFVIQLEQLVALYQQHAESRVALIRMIQGISLFITVILVVVIMFQLQRKVEKPLSELTRSAKQIMSGDYTAHTFISQNDELGFLSKTMNQMADAVAQSHVQLERRVLSKTEQLRQSKDSLELLYETTNLLSRTSKNLDLEPIVKKLSRISGLTDLDLCLMTNEGSTPYEHILTTDKVLSDRCQAKDCSGCISESTGCEPKDQLETLSIRYPLRKGDMNFGVLVCNLPKGASLADWQHQLLHSITNQIATGLKLRQQSEQNRRFALVNERTVIARELHDSLAQALSYLKIQVTRLQKAQQKGASQEQVDDVIGELKTGLNSAYRQLRELLSTFRLKIDADGLKVAFEKTIHQLNGRAGEKLQFELDYQIGNLPLTPNEEIHLMQIAREATQNVLHHSKGTESTVAVFEDEARQIHLIVEDNGIGIPDDPEKLNHYGLAIMKERSSHLKGEISIQNKESGGARLELVYRPQYLQKEIGQWQASSFA